MMNSLPVAIVSGANALELLTCRPVLELLFSSLPLRHFSFFPFQYSSCLHLFFPELFGTLIYISIDHLIIPQLSFYIRPNGCPSS